eukprot:653931-Pelagomonas_calceolata.AAC.1
MALPCSDRETLRVSQVEPSSIKMLTAQACARYLEQVGLHLAPRTHSQRVTEGCASTQTRPGHHVLCAGPQHRTPGDVGVGCIHCAGKVFGKGMGCGNTRVKSVSCAVRVPGARVAVCPFKPKLIAHPFEGRWQSFWQGIRPGTHALVSALVTPTMPLLHSLQCSVPLPMPANKAGNASSNSMCSSMGLAIHSAMVPLTQCIKGQWKVSKGALKRQAGGITREQRLHSPHLPSTSNGDLPMCLVTCPLAVNTAL